MVSDKDRVLELGYPCGQLRRNPSLKLYTRWFHTEGSRKCNCHHRFARSYPDDAMRLGKPMAYFAESQSAKR